MRNCLKCNKTKEECQCEGGFKVMFHFGIPKSHKEMDEFEKQDELTKKTQINDFMAKRLNQLNETIDKNLKIINKNKMVTDEQILKMVKSILVEKFLIDEGNVKLNSTMDSLGLDSLDTVENIMALEVAYNISIPDETGLGGLTTKVQDLVNYIRDHVN